MATRLKKAGAKDEKSIFSKAAIKAIDRYSGGYPRMINILADNSLLLGFSKAKRKITARMVRQSYEDMGLNDVFPSTGTNTPEVSEITKTRVVTAGQFWKWATAVCFVIAIIGVGMCRKGSAVLQHFSGAVPAGQQSHSGKMPGQYVTREKVVASPMDEVTIQGPADALEKTEESPQMVQ
jgi:hypothetical protein